MKWKKYTLKTTTEAEDIISNMMMEAGIEGIEIEDVTVEPVAPISIGGASP